MIIFTALRRYGFKKDFLKTSNFGRDLGKKWGVPNLCISQKIYYICYFYSIGK
jgi:hypothetical protein